MSLIVAASVCGVACRGSISAVMRRSRNDHYSGAVAMAFVPGRRSSADLLLDDDGSCALVGQNWAGLLNDGGSAVTARCGRSRGGRGTRVWRVQRQCRIIVGAARPGRVTGGGRSSDIRSSLWRQGKRAGRGARVVNTGISGRHVSADCDLACWCLYLISRLFCEGAVDWIVMISEGYCRCGGSCLWTGLERK